MQKLENTRLKASTLVGDPQSAKVTCDKTAVEDQRRIVMQFSLHSWRNGSFLCRYTQIDWLGDIDSSHYASENEPTVKGKCYKCERRLFVAATLVMKSLLDCRVTVEEFSPDIVLCGWLG